MKRLIFTFLIIVPTLSFSQPQMPIKEGRVFYEDVDSMINISKVDLYNKSKIWFVNTFNNAKAILQMEDKDAGIIMGKGVAEFDAGNVLTGTLRNFITYTVNVNVKDNKYRIQIYDISVTNQSVTYTPEYCLKYPKMNKKKLEKIDNNIQGLIASFKAALKKKSEDNF